jgi:phage-related protein
MRHNKGMDMERPTIKPVAWLGSSHKDLKAFPFSAQAKIGYGLYLAQTGQKPPRAKPLSGFGSAGVLEIVEDHDGDTYRAVYTVRLAENIYVLHCFQKKSTQGIKTPQRDINIIRLRLQSANEAHQVWLNEQGQED